MSKNYSKKDCDINWPKKTSYSIDNCIKNNNSNQIYTYTLCSMIASNKNVTVITSIALNKTLTGFQMIQCSLAPLGMSYHEVIRYSLYHIESINMKTILIWCNIAMLENDLTTGLWICSLRVLESFFMHFTNFRQWLIRTEPEYNRASDKKQPAGRKLYKHNLNQFEY